MIRKRLRETVRKTEEQGVYEAIERGQGKTLCETGCATCSHQEVYTQVIGLDSSGSETIPSPVRVLSYGERGQACSDAVSCRVWIPHLVRGTLKVEPTIICPNCKAEIKLTESLAAPLIESTRREYEKRLAEKGQTQRGTFPIYCDKRFWPLPSHRDKGMEGKLEVR